MNDTLTPEAVMVETSGQVPAGAVTEARERIASVSRFTAKPILYARVNLAYSPSLSPGERCAARAVLDVNGQPVHAQAEAETMHLAIVEVQHRLRVGLDRLSYRPAHRG
ncbi:hypothetical protein AB0C10_19420 [Microbispora amethystogenes]|uniref:hypothetical protein n=1 Tax=Microbispora amethystogenes TaxID=1427754 RepID=UPI0033E6B679